MPPLRTPALAAGQAATRAPTRHRLRLRCAFHPRQPEPERRPRAVIALRPDAAAVALDDRSADPQSDSHPIALRRVERVEEAIGRLDTHTRIGNGQAHSAAITCRLDHDLARASVDV